MNLTESTPDTRKRNNPIVSTPASRAADPDYLATVCGECGQNAERIVTVGEERDWETRTADICRPCLVAALAALDAAP